MQKKDENAVTRADRERAKIFLLILFLCAVVIIFGALTSAVIVRMSDKNWFIFKIPFEFTVSTICLLVSSVTMSLGSFFTRRAKRWPAAVFILATLILGVVFTKLQFDGWAQLVKNNIFFVDNLTNNISGSFFYIITAVHVAHLVGGLFALLISFIKSAAGMYTPERHLGVKLTAIYWHFLDGLWLYLFLFWNFADQLF